MPGAVSFFYKHKYVISYGISLAILLFLLKWLEMRFVIINHSLEIYIGAIAILFTSLGIWLAMKLTKPLTIFVEKEVFVQSENTFLPNRKEIEKLGISRRELEVLQLISAGFSNQEIADKLFLSLNTIKTHSSNLFGKMEVKSRTQAMEKAKRLNIIAK